MGGGSSKKTQNPPPREPTPQPSPPTPTPSPPREPTPQPPAPSPTQQLDPTNPPNDDVDDGGSFFEQPTISEEDMTFEYNNDDFPSPNMLKAYNQRHLLEHGNEHKSRFSADGRLMPQPPLITRDQLFSYDDLAALDKKAASIPDYLLDGLIGELADHIRSLTVSNLESVRVAYSWVVHALDTNVAVKTPTEGRYTVLDRITDLRNNKLSPNQLLEELLRHMDLQVESVSGLVRSDNGLDSSLPFPTSSPTPPARENLPKSDSALKYRKWLAVALDDSWFLIDAYSVHDCYFKKSSEWSLQKQLPGRTSTSSNKTGNTESVNDGNSDTTSDAGRQRSSYIIRRNINAYFMTNPEYFVYSHFPVDHKWQLLARPVQIDEFVRMAELTPSFFNLKLEPNYNSRERMLKYRSEDNVFREEELREEEDDGNVGQLCIDFTQPNNARYHYNYRFSKFDEPKSVRENSGDGRFLDRYVFIENRTDCSMRCSINFPTSGQYLLDLFCHDVDDTDHPSTFQLICSYRIDATVAEDQQPPRPFPINRRTEWGPGWEMERAGLKPLLRAENSMISVKDGKELYLKFDVLNEAEDDCGKYLVYISSDLKTKNDMRRYVFLYDDFDVNDDLHQLVITAKFPEPGWYVMSLLARKSKDNGDERQRGVETPSDLRFSFVCCYLLKVYKAADDPTPYPKVTSGRLGPTELAKRLEVSPVSHRSGYFQIHDDEELTIVFDALKSPCSFLTELRLQIRGSVGDSKELDDMVFVEENSDGSGATFTVRFPEKGQYVLRIFARNLSQAAARYAPIYTYMIEVDQPTSRFGPFPHRFVHWSNNCRLIRPANLVGILPINSLIPFSALIPHATEVRLTKSDGQSFSLQRASQEQYDADDDEDNIWNADINTGSEGQLTLSASFDTESPERSREMKKLLSFQVMNVVRTNAMKTKTNEEIIEKIIQANTRNKKTDTQRQEDASKLREVNEISSNKQSTTYDEKTKTDEQEKIKRHEKDQELERTRRAKEILELEEEERQRKVNDRRDAVYELQIQNRIDRLRQALRTAIDRQDTMALRETINEIESRDLQRDIGEDYEKAIKLMSSIERLNIFKKAVISVDRPMMTELRSYHNPPEQLHQVLRATLLVLGVPESLTDAWQDCQRAMSITGNKSSMLYRISTFQINRLHPDIAKRALRILDKCNRQEVRDVCFGAAILYDWTEAVCQERIAILNADNVESRQIELNSNR